MPPRCSRSGAREIWIAIPHPDFLYRTGPHLRVSRLLDMASPAIRRSSVPPRRDATSFICSVGIHSPEKVVVGIREKVRGVHRTGERLGFLRKLEVDTEGLRNILCETAISIWKDCFRSVVKSDFCPVEAEILHAQDSAVVAVGDGAAVSAAFSSRSKVPPGARFSGDDTSHRIGISSRKLGVVVEIRPCQGQGTLDIRT